MRSLAVALTLAAVTLLVLLASLFASAFPSIRAAGTSPADPLREV